MEDYTNSKEWQAYLELQRERPDYFKASELIDIITDPILVGKYVNDTGKKIGVVYKSPWNMMVVDLVKNPEGKLFAYERLLPATSSPAVVMLTQCGDKYVMINQFRHAIRQKQLCFPRGFGETGLSAKENAVKEIEEELGTKISMQDVTLIGQVTGDSGMIGNLVTVCHCVVKDYVTKNGYEGIADTELYTEAEIDELIRKGKLTDGFTLAAWALLKTNCE